MTTANKSMRQERSTLVKVIGDRMRQARELCNLTQITASKRLGYKTSSKLSKIETATNASSVPFWLIERAARVYEVSTDFLFGRIDDWETGSRMTLERNTSQWMFDAWETLRQRDMNVLKLLHDRTETLASAVSSSLSATEDIQAALNRFSELNSDFEENMRGGARLVAAVERASTAAREADSRMKKHKMGLKLKLSDPRQLSLSFL
jgi:transcriptional regulator with XRE-family HTH domain